MKKLPRSFKTIWSYASFAVIFKHALKVHAPPVTHGWGRTPVIASVDGREWETSVWRGKNGETLLPVPKKIRGIKGHDDTVAVRGFVIARLLSCGLLRTFVS